MDAPTISKHVILNGMPIKLHDNGDGTYAIYMVEGATPDLQAILFKGPGTPINLVDNGDGTYSLCVKRSNTRDDVINLNNMPINVVANGTGYEIGIAVAGPWVDHAFVNGMPLALKSDGNSGFVLGVVLSGSSDTKVDWFGEPIGLVLNNGYYVLMGYEE